MWVLHSTFGELVEYAAGIYQSVLSQTASEHFYFKKEVNLGSCVQLRSPG